MTVPGPAGRPGVLTSQDGPGRGPPTARAAERSASGCHGEPGPGRRDRPGTVLVLGHWPMPALSAADSWVLPVPALVEASMNLGLSPSPRLSGSPGHET